MNTRTLFIHSGIRMSLVAIGLAAAIAMASSGCSSDAAANPEAPQAAEVGVATVVSTPVRQWDEFSGRVAAIESVELRPRVSGYVQRVAYDEGSEVAKGDLLFVIDQRPYRAALDQALAQLERARAEAGLARSQHARAKSLIEIRAISREELETRHAATAESQAGVQAAEAAVAAARLDLQFTEVRAPVAGRAGRALVTTGNLAQADATLLTTVVSQDPVHVHFEADERAFLRYQALARSGERDANSNPVRIGLADETGHPHAGIVDFIDNQVESSTGTVRARAVVPNPDRMFTPGLFARVQLQGSAEFDALLVDDKAVLTDQDRKYVYVVGEDSTAERRDVVLGRMNDGLRVVQSGLEPGDQVIVNGVQRIFFPGMPVAPTAVAMTPPDATDSVAVADLP